MGLTRLSRFSFEGIENPESGIPKSGVVKLDKLVISKPKSDISNWTLWTRFGSKRPKLDVFSRFQSSGGLCNHDGNAERNLKVCEQTKAAIIDFKARTVTIASVSTDYVDVKALFEGTKVWSMRSNGIPKR